MKHRFHCSLSAIVQSTLLVILALPAFAQNDIGININGRTIDADPAPVMQKGSVFVPLRGVLESLGAKVTYDPATSRIDIVQAGQAYSMRVGQDYALAGARVVTLPAAPVSIGRRAFVPLRALAELFGYQVQWLASTKTVVIASKEEGGVALATADHKAALALAGRFGVGINFHDAAPNEVGPLLDAAKNAGATLIKFRFDWNALEPEQGGVFQWTLYDRVVREARERGLTCVGVLGNTPRWATRLPHSKSAIEWRNTVPLASAFPAWENYVRRVIGRYKNDVHAWQIWENPATYNFRGGEAKDYRVLVRRAVDAARASDAKAILYAAEPGGVNIGFVEDLARNGVLPLVNGVVLFPTSQWQPGVPAQPEEALLPMATLQKSAATKGEGYWIGGLSRLSLETLDLQAGRAENIFRSKDFALRGKLANTFTPVAQADYLVRSMTLSLASGADKVFWANLRDESEYDLVDPVNSLYGGGLLRRDMTLRPAYSAYALLSRLLAGRHYVGALSNGPRALVLVFADAKNEEAVGVTWAVPEAAEQKLVLNPERNPEVPESVFVNTRADAKLLDAIGTEVNGAAGAFALATRPLWITQLNYKVLSELREKANANAPLLVNTGEKPDYSTSGLRAVFAPGDAGAEQGLAWRKYLGFRGAATAFRTFDDKTGLQTTYSRDIYNPAAGQPYIYLDVANDYLYNERGVSVKVTVEVKRNPVIGGVFAPQAGFNLQYDSLTGFKTTPWQNMEGGEGWATFTYTIPDAAFSNRDGYDLLVNTWGSRQDLVFRSITLRKGE